MKLILGGARSGKSSQAKRMAGEFKAVVLIATGLPTDEEMKRRIKKHQKNRPSRWSTWEEPIEVLACLEELKDRSFSGAVVLDCLGFWVSNLMDELKDVEDELMEKEILSAAREVMKFAKICPFEFIVVSNLVGMGIIPSTKIGRRFRDILGQVNRIGANFADQVLLMVAGIKQELK